MNPDQLAAHGWRVVSSGQWLIETVRRPTASELEAARVLATQYGLRLETRDSHARLANISAGAVAVGMLLAARDLGDDHRPHPRRVDGGVAHAHGNRSHEVHATRAITAVTAASLAALGALLGMAGAYVGLAAGRLSHLLPLPFTELAVIVIGTPLVALAAGWLFAGREPAAIARRPLD